MGKKNPIFRERAKRLTMALLAFMGMSAGAAAQELSYSVLFSPDALEAYAEVDIYTSAKDDYQITVPDSVVIEEQKMAVKVVSSSSLNSSAGFVKLTLPSTIEQINSPMIGPGLILLRALGSVPPVLNGVTLGNNVVLLSNTGDAEAYREAWGESGVRYFNGSSYVEFSVSGYGGESLVEMDSSMIDSSYVRLSVKPQPGYSYTVWTSPLIGGGESADTIVSNSADTAKYKVDITDDSYLFVDLEPIFYKVNSETNYEEAYGEFSLSGQSMVGDLVQVSVKPNAGYKAEVAIVSASGDTISYDLSSSRYGDRYQFNMPAEDVTVYATFSLVDYVISVESEGGYLTIPETAHVGDTVRFVPVPEEGYSLAYINGPWQIGSIDTTYFVMPAMDVALEAKFVKSRDIDVKVVIGSVVVAQGDTSVSDLQSVDLLAFASKLEGLGEYLNDNVFESLKINGVSMRERYAWTEYPVDGEDIFAVFKLTAAKPLNIVITADGDTVVTDTQLVVPGSEGNALNYLSWGLYLPLDDIYSSEQYYRNGVTLDGEDVAVVREFIPEYGDVYERASFVMPDSASTLVVDFRSIEDINVDFTILADGDTVAHDVFTHSPTYYLYNEDILRTDSLVSAYNHNIEGKHLASVTFNGVSQEINSLSFGGYYEDVKIVYELKSAAPYELSLEIVNEDGSKEIPFVLCSPLSGNWVSVSDTIRNDDFLTGLVEKMDTVLYDFYLNGKEFYDGFEMPDSALTVTLKFVGNSSEEETLDDLTVRIVCDGDTVLNKTLPEFYYSFSGVCYTCMRYRMEDIMQLEEIAALDKVDEYYGEDEYTLVGADVNGKDKYADWLQDLTNLDMSERNMVITLEYKRGYILTTELLLSSNVSNKLVLENATAMTGDKVIVSVASDTIVVESIRLVEDPETVFTPEGDGKYSFIMPFTYFATIDATFLASSNQSGDTPSDSTNVPVAHAVKVGTVVGGNVVLLQEEAVSGDTVSVLLIANEGFVPEAVTVNGDTVAIAEDGTASFIMGDVDVEIVVTFKDNSSDAIHVVSAQGVQVEVVGRKLIVSGADSFNVFDLLGRPVATSKNGTAVVKAKGIYLVVVNGVGCRVLVK